MALKDSSKSKKKPDQIPSDRLSKRISSGPDARGSGMKATELYKTVLQPGQNQNVDALPIEQIQQAVDNTPSAANMGSSIPRGPYPDMMDERPVKPEGSANPAFDQRGTMYSQDVGPDDLDDSLDDELIQRGRKPPSTLEKIVNPNVNEKGEEESDLTTSINKEKEVTSKIKGLNLDPQKEADVKSIMDQKNQDDFRTELNTGLKELNEMNNVDEAQGLGEEGQEKPPATADQLEKTRTPAGTSFMDLLRSGMEVADDWSFVIPAIVGAIGGDSTTMTAGLETTKELIDADTAIEGKEKLEALKHIHAKEMQMIKGNQALGLASHKSDLNFDEYIKKFPLETQKMLMKAKAQADANVAEFNAKTPGVEQRDANKQGVKHLYDQANQRAKSGLKTEEQDLDDQVQFKDDKGRVRQISRAAYNAIPDKMKPSIITTSGSRGLDSAEWDRRHEKEMEGKREMNKDRGTGKNVKIGVNEYGEDIYRIVYKGSNKDRMGKDGPIKEIGKFKSDKYVKGPLTVQQRKNVDKSVTTYEKNTATIREADRFASMAQQYMKEGNALMDRGALVGWIKTFDSRISNLDVELYTRQTGIIGGIESRIKETFGKALDPVIVTSLRKALLSTLSANQKYRRKMFVNEAKRLSVNSGMSIDQAMEQIAPSVRDGMIRSAKQRRAFDKKEGKKQLHPLVGYKGVAGTYLGGDIKNPNNWYKEK